MRITLTEQDGASAVLAAIAEKVTSRKPLHAVLGKRAEIELRGHFELRNSEGNKRGWPSQQFWARIRTATAFASADETAARVVISDPAINQKIFGGTITPKESKYLALPAIAEAYGRSPRSVPIALVFRFFRGKNMGALIEADRTNISFGRKRKDGSRKMTAERSQTRGRVWYWLVRSVTQRKDDRALPPEEQMRAALLDAAKAYLDRL